MAYDAKTDYMALMQQAAAQGDYRKAAEYEQARNAKITGEGITQYKPTSYYAGNLDTTDYGTIMQKQMAGGADANTVRNTLEQRTNKANSAVNLNQYAYDDKYKQAMEYIKRTQSRTEAVAPTSQEGYVNSLYKAQQEAALAKLKAAYDQNVIDVDAQAAKIPQTYQTARNQTAATAEQNRAAFNERAAAYGLNSGTGGQADLAMRNQNAANMSAINQQQANAINDLDTTRLRISTAYQNDIAQAVATGDLARAQALYQEAVRVDNGLVAQSQAQADEDYRYWAANNTYNQQQQASQLETAENLAAYGDFSGYLALGYPQIKIEEMQKVWAAANPLLAQARGISTFNAGTGGGYRSSGGGSYSGGSGTTPTTGGNLFGGGSATIPADIDYKVGMNRTKTGQRAAINRLYDAGEITEAQANALYDKFKIDA